MELKDTIALMQSDDYKERFKAEYYQLSERVHRLIQMVDKWEAGVLEFTPKCECRIYMEQIDAMLKYKEVLKTRAVIEGIEVDD